MTSMSLLGVPFDEILIRRINPGPFLLAKALGNLLAVYVDERGGPPKTGGYSLAGSPSMSIAALPPAALTDGVFKQGLV